MFICCNPSSDLRERYKSTFANCKIKFQKSKEVLQELTKTIQTQGFQISFRALTTVLSHHTVQSLVWAHPYSRWAVIAAT